MILAGSLLTIGVSAFAFYRGGEAERVVSVVAMIALFGSLWGQSLVGRLNAWPVIGADVFLGVAVGIVAAVHLRAWLFVEFGLAACLLLIHGAMLQAGGSGVTPLYAVLVDGVNLLMLGTLVVAVARFRRPDPDALFAVAPGAGGRDRRGG